VYKKIAEVEKSRMQDQKQITQDIDNFKLKFSKIAERFDEIHKANESNAENIRSIILDIEKANERIIQAKEMNNKFINENTHNIGSQIKYIVDDIVELKITTSSHHRSIAEYGANFINNDNQIKLLYEQMEKAIKKIQQMSNDKLDKITNTENMKTIWESIRESQVQINQHYNHVLTIENFVDKYAPMRTMTQISDLLHV
jgi:chromosome segregation ATPase